MKKYILTFVLSFVMLIGFASVSQARDMTGRFGIGVDTTIQAGRGLAATYYLNKWIGLQALVGIDIQNVSPEGVDASATRTDWLIAVRGIVPFQISDSVNLGALLGLNFHGLTGKTRQGNTSRSDTDFDFSFDLALRPEWFPAENFSIHMMVGLSFLFAGDRNFDGDRGEYLRVNFFSMGDLFGSAGFTYYF